MGLKRRGLEPGLRDLTLEHGASPRPDQARSFAEVMGVTFIGIAGMLFHAFVKKHLTLAELEDAVEALSQTIWLAPAVVAEILKKAREGER